MSKKKVLLSALVSTLVKDVSDTMPSAQLEEIEGKIQSDLARKLGDKWTDLPATGPYMIIVYLAMNLIFIPLGISPPLLADKVIVKGNELGFEKKSVQLIKGVKSGIKSTGEFSNEKYHEISMYLKETSERGNFSDRFKHELDSATGVVKSGIGKSKSFFSKMLGFSRNKQDD